MCVRVLKSPRQTTRQAFTVALLANIAALDTGVVTSERQVVEQTAQNLTRATVEPCPVIANVK